MTAAQQHRTSVGTNLAISLFPGRLGLRFALGRRYWGRR